MPDLTAIAIVFLIFGLPVVSIVASIGLLLTWNLRRRELAVRELEAQARIQAAEPMPAWLDRTDVQALTEWKLAQRELDRVAAKASLARG